MSVLDLVFTSTVEASQIYDPLQLAGTPHSVTVTNMGPDDLTSLGLYIVPSTDLGSVDYPSDNPPETDYQDLLEWGTSTDLGLTPQGGLKVTAPINGGGTPTTYFTRSSGSRYQDRIAFIDLASGDSATFILELETPPAVPARRLYINVVLE